MGENISGWSEKEIGKWVERRMGEGGKTTMVTHSRFVATPLSLSPTRDGEGRRISEYASARENELSVERNDDCVSKRGNLTTILHENSLFLRLINEFVSFREIGFENVTQTIETTALSLCNVVNDR